MTPLPGPLCRAPLFCLLKCPPTCWPANRPSSVGLAQPPLQPWPHRGLRGTVLSSFQTELYLDPGSATSWPVWVSRFHPWRTKLPQYPVPRPNPKAGLGRAEVRAAAPPGVGCYGCIKSRRQCPLKTEEGSCPLICSLSIQTEPELAADASAERT